MKKIILIFFAFILSTLPSDAIKIGLYDGIMETRVGTDRNGIILNNDTRAILFNTERKKAYKIFPIGSSIGIEVRGKRHNLNTNKIEIRNLTNEGFMYAKKRWYRGHILVINKDGKLIVINELPLEDYLKGVVPSEMPTRWNIEAHKAQAIAARSWAISNLNKRIKRGYNLLDTPMDQAYRGANAETRKTNQAVEATRGVVMTYNNKIITAYYHASSGGQTKASGAVWAKDLPYLKSVEGYDWGRKKFGHGVGMSQHGANNLANRGYKDYQILNHFYNNVNFARVKDVSLTRL